MADETVLWAPESQRTLRNINKLRKRPYRFLTNFLGIFERHFASVPLGVRVRSEREWIGECLSGRGPPCAMSDTVSTTLGLLACSFLIYVLLQCIAYKKSAAGKSAENEKDSCRKSRASAIFDLSPAHGGRRINCTQIQPKGQRNLAVKQDGPCGSRPRTNGSGSIARGLVPGRNL